MSGHASCGRNKTPIQTGRCFSIEPTVVIYGELGVRLEDVACITPHDPKFFTNQSPLDRQAVRLISHGGILTLSCSSMGEFFGKRALFGLFWLQVAKESGVPIVLTFRDREDRDENS